MLPDCIILNNSFKINGVGETYFSKLQIYWYKVAEGQINDLNSDNL